MKIHGMLLVRNEVDRWLDKYIKQMQYLCDTMTVLDDSSTDGTAEMLKEAGFDVYTCPKSLWGINELEQRQKLWDLTLKFIDVKEDNIILCLDADELFVESHLPFIKYVLKNLPSGVDAAGFKLHDMWSDTHYRQDQFWQAHFHYWPMAVRYDPNKKYFWNNKPLHCGRFPQNAASQMIPTQIPLLHMGWSRESDRIKKYSRYMEIDPQGKNGILEQYKSILDENPNLIEFYSDKDNRKSEPRNLKFTTSVEFV